MDLDEPLSGHQLAQRAGLPEPTLRYWRTKHGLPTDHRGRATLRNLLTFAREHQHHLPKSDGLLRRFAAVTTSAAEVQPDTRTTPEEPRRTAPDEAINREAINREAADVEHLQSVARAARNAARDHLEALITATRANLTVLELLQSSYTELDDVLVTFTAPATPKGL
jgi:hypothetical protein